ncbi:hypothetical protein [Streptomyces sp. NPDC088789]|uniref:toxin-antitoxin system YwqK family antitoxin n=1 Tax=Streptomyces sp. NPDC088789 TaxID=3365899 RepID=UPI003805C29E
MTMQRATFPDRPEGVPAEAEWLAEDREWALGETGARGRTGEWRCWRPDGSLAETSRWVDGRMHGLHLRYHDDGSVAMEGPWVEGRRGTTVLYRADAPTQETTMEQLPRSVRRMVQDFDAEGYFVRQRFYTADGTEVDLDGEPIPPRPANVAEGAQHATRHRHWYLQRFEPDGQERSVGLHLFWETDGTFKAADYHTLDGGLVARVGTTGRCKGSPLVAADTAGDEQAVEDCLGLGFGTSPGAALHAAFEGRPALALRLRDGAADPARTGFTDPRTEPERRDVVPDDAVWVAGLASWVVGEADRTTGAALGTWRLWQDAPHLDNAQPIVVEFTDGFPTLRREYVAWRHDDLDEERTYGPRGAVRVHRRYEKGRLKRETEYLTEPPGAVADRRFHGDGALMVERVERDGELLSEVWFAEDGTREAEVSPSDVLVEDEPVEWWRALDATGAVIAEGAVLPGLKGGPEGRWRLYGPDGAEAAVTDFEGLSVARTGELGRFAHAVHTWRTTPLPAALAGVDDIDWDALGSFFGVDTSFPFLLRGLAAPDELASGHALGELWDNVLHQHTVSEVAGPALRFVIALAEERPHDEELLDLVLHVVTRDGSPGAVRQLKALHTAALGADDPAAHFGEAGVEPAYHEIYTCLGAAAPTWARLAEDPGTPRDARRIAFHLLAAAPGEAAAVALRTCLTTQAARDDVPDRELLADLLLCLGLTPGDTTRDLVAPFLDDKDPLLAFCAALTWARIGADPLSPALPLLIDALGGPSDLDAFGGHWFAEADAATDALRALSQLPPEHSRHALEAMCALLDTPNPYRVSSLAGSLLDLVFPTEAYAGGAPLTAEQRRVVMALTGHVGDGSVIDVDLNEVLRYNGLPCTADELRALCALE